ncbi:MAG: hypothetical protein WCS15_03150 [Prevotella sp.]
MKIVNCVWEIRNIGCKTAELTFEKGERVDKAVFDCLDQEYDYIVVRAPILEGKMYADLSSRGYSFIENQITFEKRWQDFIVMDRLYKRTLDKVTISKVIDEADLKRLLSRITRDMFVTDRISLDPHFGADYAVRRYCYWSEDMYHQGYNVYKVNLDGKEVAFSINKITADGTLVVPLGGGFTDVDGVATGPTALLAIYKMKETGMVFKRFKAKISSNNLPMIRVYNKLQFEQTHFDYIFVKHINR